VVARFCREIEHVLSDSRIWRQKNSAPDCMTDAPETGASFLASVSGACVMGITDFTRPAGHFQSQKCTLKAGQDNRSRVESPSSATRTRIRAALYNDVVHVNNGIDRGGGGG